MESRLSRPSDMRWIRSHRLVAGFGEDFGAVAMVLFRGDLVPDVRIGQCFEPLLLGLSRSGRGWCARRRRRLGRRRLESGFGGRLDASRLLRRGRGIFTNFGNVMALGFGFEASARIFAGFDLGFTVQA